MAEVWIRRFLRAPLSCLDAPLQHWGRPYMTTLFDDTILSLKEIAKEEDVIGSYRPRATRGKGMPASDRDAGPPAPGISNSPKSSRVAETAPFAWGG